jgi:hypothetical protein
MESLYKKLEELLKAVKSQARPMHPPLPKMPEIKPVASPTASAGGSKPPKMPGINPGSKKDPVKVAQQLKQGKTQKKTMPLLKVEKNGQWSLE